MELIVDFVIYLHHATVLEDTENFQLIYENKKSNVVIQIDSSHKRKQLENRQKLIPIIRAVLLCGRQGLALRGHRDFGLLSLKMTEDNNGNFRSLLRFAIESGDSALNNHFKTCANNATYLSPSIQNYIIYAAIADETMDLGGVEQFSMCARYVNQVGNKFQIRDDFLCFVPVEIITGKELANKLLSTLKKLGVDVDFMREQGNFKNNNFFIMEKIFAI